MGSMAGSALAVAIATIYGVLAAASADGNGRAAVYLTRVAAVGRGGTTE